MQCSKSLGYLAYPLLTFFLAAALSMQAQTTGDPQQSAPPAQSPAPTTDAQPTPLTPTAPVPTTRDPISQAQQQQSGSSSGSQPQANYPNEQERVRLAQEAQARVRARRASRTAAVIKDTYSHKYDIYFGYNYLRMRPGHFLQHGNENGWDAGITRYFNPKFGLSLDLRGYYKSVYAGNVRYFIPGTDPNTGQPIYGTVEGMFQPFISNYSAMVGPQYWVRQRKAYAVGFQVLAGATYNIFNANSAGLPGYYVGLYDNGTRFTAAATMPVDINLGPGLAFRIAPDYNLTTWKYRYDTVSGTAVNHQYSGTDLQHNLGFMLGLNYRFGRQ